MPFFSRKKHHFTSPPADGLASQSAQQPWSVCTWSAHTPQSGPSPFPRGDHTLTATATAAGEFLLFGGWAHDCAHNDVYMFSTRDFSTTLLKTSGEVPTPRRAHGAALIGTTLLICGGRPDFKTRMCQIMIHFIFSTLLCAPESREWTRVVVNNPGPHSRIYQTTTVVGSKLFVFGGRIGGNIFNDMWTLDLNSLKSPPVWESYESTPGNEKPLPRAGHVSVVIEGRIIMFGGRDDQHFYNDTWSFDISTRKWTVLQCTGSIPSPRAGHAAVLVDDVMYVFGGFTGKTYSDDLIALQLSTHRWFKFHNVGLSPHGKSAHAMVSDGTRVFVVGGYSKGAQEDELSLTHVFDTKDIKYPEPERNAVNPNEKANQLARKSFTGPPTQEQSPHRKSSSSETHGSRLQNATPAVSGHLATLQIAHQRNPDVNSKPRRVPEDDVGQASMAYDAKFAAPHFSSEGEIARLEPERQPPVSLAAQTERDERIARLTALLEQAEANAAETAKRAGLHADRLLMQTSLVEQRDAELVDMHARLDELQLSRDQQEVALQDLRSQFSDSQTTVLRLESENKRITRQLNKSPEAADQHKNEAERLKNGMEELKAKHETAIAQAPRQAGSLRRDKFDLQQSLDTLKAEMARLNPRLPHMGSPMTPEVREPSDLLTPNDREMGDVFTPSTGRKRGDTSAMFSASGNFDSSPDVSPSRPSQVHNHPSNEVEALQQYEKELTNARSKLEAQESELEAVRLRLTDAEKGWTKSKAEADTLRAQTATSSVNRDDDPVTRRLMERMRAIEAEIVSKRWNEKSIEEMECSNEG